MYWLFQASELLHCPPWILVKQPTFWMDRVFWFYEVRDKVQAAKSRIVAHRNGEQVPRLDDD